MSDDDVPEPSRCARLLLPYVGDRHAMLPFLGLNNGRGTFTAWVGYRHHVMVTKRRKKGRTHEVLQPLVCLQFVHVEELPNVMPISHVFVNETTKWRRFPNGVRVNFKARVKIYYRADGSFGLTFMSIRSLHQVP